MNGEFQLKLQAYLDGELSEKEARKVEASLAADPEAQLLLAELENTNRALSVFEQETKLPESREFFWSKIHRNIRALESQPERESSKPSWLATFFLRRALIPIGTFAAIALVAILTIKQAGTSSKLSNLNGVEIAMVDDSEAVTFTDNSSDMTVVWLSYPAEKEFTESATEDILQ